MGNGIRKYLKTLGFLLALVGVVVAIWHIPNAIDNLRYDDFLVTGTVVDDEGKPLDDVTVNISGGRRDLAGTKATYNSRYEKVSGAFRVDERNQSSLRLTFIKAGYQYDYLDFLHGGNYRDVRMVMKRGDGPASRPATTPNKPLGR